MRAGTVVETHYAWQAPLPAPHDLEKYNQLVPNGAERIMASFERQEEHRHFIEKKVISSRVWTTRLGQVFALLIALACLSLAAYCVTLGERVLAGVIVGTKLTALVTSFIYSGHSQRMERQERRKQESQE